MDQFNDIEWQLKIQQAASRLRYPPTPDVTNAVIQHINAQKTSQPVQLRVKRAPRRWLAPALGLFVVILCALSLVPGVRAQVQEFLQVGPLRIFFAASTTFPTPLEEVPSLPSSFMELAGHTTFSEASSRWQYPLRLPAYPADLGEPDLAFLQGPNNETLILAWLEPGSNQEVRLALQALAPGEGLYTKSAPESIEQTVVNGDEAYWIVGEHLLEMKNGDYTRVRLVAGHVLVWSDGELTYRLESKLPMEEAVRIAESLR